MSQLISQTPETTEKLVLNLLNKVKHAQLDGVDYLVANGVILVEGVLPGSDGPLFYPKESYTVNAEDWNGVPMTVYHPVINGKPVSARTPSIMQKQCIGFLANTAIEDDKLRPELWFNVDKTKLVDVRVYNSLLAGESIELSTGLFAVKEKAPEGAVFNGTMYTHIVKSMRPDHLAILPDEKGACSLQMGCGVLVNSTTLIENKLTHDDIYSGLCKLLENQYGVDEWGMGKAYVVDVFDREFVYRQNGKLYRNKYSTDNRTGKLEMTGNAEEVRRVTTYKAVTNEVRNMKKEELVQWLTTNCDCWKTEGSADVLNGFDDARLTNLKVMAEAAKKQKESAPVAEPVINKNEPAKPLNFSDWMGLAPVEVQQVVTNALERDKKERKDLIEKLIANVSEESKQATVEMFKSKPVEELRRLVEITNANKPTVTKVNDPWNIPGTEVDYSGQAITENAGQTNNRDDSPLIPATIEW